jgi:SAM-dependent methyltransferase
MRSGEVSVKGAGMLPEWSELVIPGSPDWRWYEGKLYHREAVSQPFPQPRISRLRSFILRNIYATQNSAKPVRKALSGLIEGLGPEDWGLNLGAGGTRIHKRILNLDIYDAEGMNVITRGHHLPFERNSLKLVISQEVLEHLPDPWSEVAEVHRVLKPGGRFFCQVPFIIGYHPGPHDFWRFTREGLGRLFPPDLWRLLTVEVALGHGSGFYRIAVEYVGVTMSVLHGKLYMPAKLFAAVLMVPFKLPDLEAHWSLQKDRNPGGYFCIAEKL